MTIQQAQQHLTGQLQHVYDQREAASIASMVMEKLTGMARVARLLEKHTLLTTQQLQELDAYTANLLQQTPVQYVLHEAWFAGMPFYVDEHVLIPRPETEELVEWICQSHHTPGIPSFSSNPLPHTFLDIGTGSGCIPVAVAKRNPHWQVHALDVSPGALQVAARNAHTLGANITFYAADILDESTWHSLPLFHLIASNPPYITRREAAQMHANVLEHEPHLALFVPDEDALLFYRAIGRFALLHLHPGGALFFEINEALGQEVCQLLSSLGFVNITLKQDLQGKDRMVKAVLPNN